MTVPSTVTSVERPGNGVAREFSFSPILIFDETQLEVVVRDAAGTLTTISRGTGASAYSVLATFTEGQSSTGSIRYPDSGGTLLPTGSFISIRRVVPFTQEVDIENQGGYLPEEQEELHDLHVMRVQQVNEEIARAVKVPFGSDVDPADYLTEIQTDAATASAAAATASAAALAAAAAAGAAGAETMTNVASAATVDLGAIPSRFANVTGTTGISSFGSNASVDFPFYTVRFDNVLTLSHSANLQLPGSSSLTTTVGDYSLWQYLGSGAWRLLELHRAGLIAVGYAPNTGSASIPATGSAESQLVLQERLSSGGSTAALVPLNGLTANRTYTLPDNTGTLVTSATEHPGYIAGRYYHGLYPFSENITTGGGWAVANSAYAQPFYVYAPVTFTGIRIEVTVTVAASTIRLGLYRMENGVPTTRIADFGTVSAATPGEKEIAISQTLQPGWYAVAFVPSSASIQVYAASSTGGFGLTALLGNGGSLPVRTVRTREYVDSTAAGSMPANFTVSSYSEGYTLVAMKV